MTLRAMTALEGEGVFAFEDNVIGSRIDPIGWSKICRLGLSDISSASKLASSAMLYS
jgi:hypothetical protein